MFLDVGSTLSIIDFTIFRFFIGFTIASSILGTKDPKVVAEELKTSLDGLKQSADYLLKSDFVK